MSLPGLGTFQRPDRRAAAEEGFLSQEPDLLGDMVPRREAAAEEVDPLPHIQSGLFQVTLGALNLAVECRVQQRVDDVTAPGHDQQHDQGECHQDGRQAGHQKAGPE